MESASLKLSEGVDVPVGPDRMWSLLTDPSTVVSCMPGAVITGTSDDGTLDGTLVTKLGPTSVTFRGTVLPEFDHEHRTGSLLARGGDARGRTKASATVTFEMSGDEQPPSSHIHIDAVINVSGGLAPFVRSGGAHLMRRMLAEFSGNLTALGADAGSTGGTGSAGATRPAVPPTRPIRGFSLIFQTVLDILRDSLRRLTRREARPTGTDDRSTP